MADASANVSPFLGLNDSIGYRSKGFKPIAFPFRSIQTSLRPLKGNERVLETCLKDRGFSAISWDMGRISGREF